MLMLLIFVQDINFSSAVTIIQPTFGAHGNVLVSFVIAVIQLVIAIIIYFILSYFVQKIRVFTFLAYFSFVFIALLYIDFCGVK